MKQSPTIAVVDPVGAKAGMDYYNKNLLEGFSHNGAQCYLYSNSESGNEGAIQSVRTFNLFSSGIFAKVSNLVFGHLKAALMCRRNKVDVVILHVFSTNFGCLAGFLITKMLGLRILAIVHDVESFADDDSLFARRRIYGSLARWISVHNHHSLELLDDFCKQQAIEATMYVAEQGDYISQTNPEVTKSSARQMLGLDEFSRYGLFFGQIKKTKGLDTLIKSMGVREPAFKLIIAGKPWKTPFDEYQNLIDENGIEDFIVKFVRYIEDEEREALFKAADFVVLPYTEIYQSAVLLMAMSYGLPVVATNIKGFSVIINEADSGLLVPVGDEEALGDATAQLAGSNELLSQLGANALRAVSTRYSWRNIAAIHLKNLTQPN